MALILLYVLAAPVTGFPLGTVGFVVGFMWVSGARSASGIGAAAALGTVGLLYLFVKAVYLPLPKGDGFFEAVTLASTACSISSERRPCSRSSATWGRGSSARSSR